MQRLSPQDLADIAKARRLIEEPGLAIQAANLLGAPIEHVLAKRLPKRATALIDQAATRAVTGAFNAAVATLRKDSEGTPARRWLHRALTIGAGAAGGFFGWAGLAVELPITTTLILRSIADIAREEGESPHELETRLACIEVLALGGPRHDDDAAESGYFATRAALAQQISAVTRHVAKHGATGGGAPVVVRLINSIASRFSIPVSQKVLAEAVPVIGAVAGASLNAIFIAHFQKAAQGHFIIRRLERTRGAAVVRQAYDELGAA
jgi:hypothetical protein